MIKKILITVALTATIISTNSLASGLYTDTYFSSSGVTKSKVDTGIANSFSADLLKNKKRVAHVSVYFVNGQVTQESQEQLEVLLNKKQNSSYLSVTGYINSFFYESHTVELDTWAQFWHNITVSPTVKRDSYATSVNKRISLVCDYLVENGVESNKIYNENRMDRDQIATEEIVEGKRVNNRVDVVLYY